MTKECMTSRNLAKRDEYPRVLSRRILSIIALGFLAIPVSSAAMAQNGSGFAHSRYLAIQAGPQVHASGNGPTVDGGRPLGSD